jgi:hypothetical protein
VSERRRKEGFGNPKQAKAKHTKTDQTDPLIHQTRATSQNRESRLRLPRWLTGGK